MTRPTEPLWQPCMIRIFIMKINAEFALFTWSCWWIFSQGTPHYRAGKGKYFCFCKASSSRRAGGTSGCNFVLPFVLATMYLYLYFCNCSYLYFLQGRLLCLGEPKEQVDATIEKTAFSLVKSRLALGSPGCLFVCLGVTKPKMVQYTEKWLFTVP